MPGGSARSHASTSAGKMHLPDPSILPASAGIGIAARGPAARIQSAAVTTIELLSGGPPEPSISTAPRKALLWLSGVGAQAQRRTRNPIGMARGVIGILHHSRAFRSISEYNRP